MNCANRHMINIVLFLLSMLPAVTLSASFDCDSELNEVEAIICQSEVLNALDEALIFQYNATKNVVYEPDLKQDQIGWIRKQQRACSTEDCLVEEYLTRIYTLRFWNTEAEVSPNRFGYYESKHSVPIYNSNREDWNDSADVVDVLSLAARSQSDLVDVYVRTVTTNGHTCTLEGAGTVRESEIVVDKDQDGAPLPNNCELHLKFYEGQITLSEEELSCKRYHCGMRAGFDGYAFTRFDITKQ